MRIKKLTLTESERNELAFGFRNGASHCFRMRCRCVLLKSEGLSSVGVGEQTEMTTQSVNGWLKREEAVRRAIESDRQSVRLAKEVRQNSSGEEANDLTFRRFLSALAQDLDVIE